MSADFRESYERLTDAVFAHSAPEIKRTFRPEEWAKFIVEDRIRLLVEISNWKQIAAQSNRDCLEAERKLDLALEEKGALSDALGVLRADLAELNRQIAELKRSRELCRED